MGDLYNLPAEEETVEAEAEPCCQGKCAEAGLEKYWSIAKSMTGVQHCGECCMDPSKYSLYHIFEKNLTKSDSDTPCSDFGFTTYDSTDTWGFGPVKMTLDLYNLPAEEETVEAEAEPCCQGKCAEAGLEKYWSIAKSMTGVQHCGEGCMDPSKYSLYHIFEKNLTKSDSDTPCSDFGFTTYDSTDTHGFGPVKMTLDLYNLPAAGFIVV